MTTQQPFASEAPVAMIRAMPALDAFFATAAAAPRRALLLDYDGTLASFRAECDQAVPYAGVRELLNALLRAKRTRVVIVSGRAIEDLARLLGIAPLPELWGSHGWERRWPDGRYASPPLGVSARAGITAAAEAALGHGLAHMLEHKPAGLALHWRGLEPRVAAILRDEIATAWGPIVLRHGLQLHPFDGGLELRAPGRNKGTAVQTLLAELGPQAAVAYLGDDLTDEDAFRQLGGRGLRVLVHPRNRPSAADIWFRPPEELLAFLERWAVMDGVRRGAAH